MYFTLFRFLRLGIAIAVVWAFPDIVVAQTNRGDETLSSLVIEYDGQSETLIEIDSASTSMPVTALMLSPDSSSVDIPILPGEYRLSFGSVDDLELSDSEMVSVGPMQPTMITINEPPPSGAATVEEHRDEYMHTSAVEASLAFQRRSRGRVRWVALGTAALTGAGATYAFLQGQAAYQDYDGAATTAAATDARRRVETSAGMAIGLGAGAAAGLIVGIIAQLVMPDIGDARAERRAAEDALENAERDYATSTARATAGAAIEREDRE